MLPWCLAFLHLHFPPRSPPSHPLIRLSAVNSSPCPGIAPQFLNSSSQPLHLPGHLIPTWGTYGCGKDCLILIPFRLPQISCFTLSLKCFSSDSDNCPHVGIGPLLQFPHWLRTGPVLLTLLFFPLVPLYYRVLHGSIYSFPLVRYSCPLSAGVLHAFLSFHLGCHRSAVSLSALNVSPLTQTIAPLWGSDPCFSSPTC